MGDVKLNSTGGGSVTLTPPSTASNLTLTLPSASGTVATTSGTGSVFTNPTINGFTGDTSAITVGTNQFVKDTSGNIGIGTSSPGFKLDVQTGGARIDQGSASGATLTLNRTSNPGSVAFQFNGTETGQIQAVSGGGLIFYRGSSPTETMRYDASGNLGLGVTPSASWGSGLKVFQMGVYSALYDGSAGAGGPGLSGNAYEYSSGAYKYLQSYYATLYRQNYIGQHQWFIAPSGTAGNAISFTQAMTLDASGNLLVGTTGSPSGAGGVGVQVYNNGGNSGRINFGKTSTTTDYACVFYYSGTNVGNITYSNTATAYVTSSDQRLKTNVTPAGSAIQSVLDFPVDQFDWISSGEHQDFGAVAQKAINFIPEMVNVPADEDDMWGIDWSKAVPRLIRTIQELAAKNDLLEARIAAMEAK